MIEFNLDPNQPGVINLTTALPTISEALFINGYSQPGSLKGPIATRVIRVNINATGAGANTNAFTISGDNVTIAGLAIYGARGYGIQGLAIPASVSNLHIWGNYIGTDSTGLNAGLGNVGGGIEVNLGSSFTPSNNIIVGIKDDGVDDGNEGNLITSSSSLSGNNGDGVLYWRCTNSVIAGNIIGLNKNGTGTGLGHTRDGIVVTVGSTNVVIGTDGDGSAADAIEGNTIARNGRNGILLAGISTNNIIAGNTVGVDLADAGAGNGTGILLLNASTNRIGTDGNGTSDALEKNIIGSNTFAGLRISSESFFGAAYESGSNGNVVKGNIIGANAGLTVSHPNGTNGIELQASLSPFTVNDNIFGTAVSNTEERNIIVNNAGNGIRVLAPGEALLLRVINFRAT
ncbi:right-handed parallel beta-helix repeat-containing protein [Paraflavitalea speifideaquila]|uniref:right-handed parallel beta-helix repeat-containing protein n=1 Tax=Paraflavitalea speifideaquila TaxID=3076558 RepID=UPI0028E5D68B|nr:right-handed parallel beta-helix repeat-containing protein [Paraflavitalea speifideiaquila]